MVCSSKGINPETKTKHESKNHIPRSQITCRVYEGIRRRNAAGKRRVNQSIDRDIHGAKRIGQLGSQFHRRLLIKRAEVTKAHFFLS